MCRYAMFLVVLMFAASAAARIIIIDDFEHPDSTADLIVDDTTTSSEDADIGIPVANVIGGSRFGLLEANDLLFKGEVTRLEINMPDAPGKLVISSFDTAHRLTRGTLGYGSKSWMGPSLSESWADLTNLMLDVDAPTALNQDVSIRLWSNVGEPGEMSPWVTKTLSTSASSLSFPLVDFTDQGLNIDDIDGIEIAFEAIPDGQDLTLDRIYVIPEPSTFTLLVLGGFPLLRRRRSC